MKIKAAVTWEKDADFKVEDVELAEPTGTQVLVKLVGTGVCHTDAVVQAQGIPVQLPAVLGHEGAGIVEQVGPDVTEVEVGDHVVLGFYSCGKCYYCRSGHANLCELNGPVNFGGVYADGTKKHSIGDQQLSSFFGQSSFGTYTIADQENCVPIDKDVDLGIMGPLGCGIGTGAGTVMNRIKPEINSTIAVFGAGAVGMSAIMMAKNAGCSKIIAIDAVDERLELAKELGATHTINGKEVEDTVAVIREITNGRGTDYSMDTSAVPALILQALDCLKIRGTCAVVGSTGEKIVPIQMQNSLMATGRTLMGVVEGDSVPKIFIPQLVELYKAGKFPFDKLIKEYKLEDINQAFEDSHKGIAIKPVIRF